jgi:hypothetical protein
LIKIDINYQAILSGGEGVVSVAGKSEEFYDRTKGILSKLSLATKMLYCFGGTNFKKFANF